MSRVSVAASGARDPFVVSGADRLPFPVGLGTVARVLRKLFDASYDELVAAWVRHLDLRKRRTSIAELAMSRVALDRLRDSTNALRRAYAPEPTEVQDALVTTFCERLGETIFLFTADADWSMGGPRFRCACGDPIDGEGDRVLV